LKTFALPEETSEAWVNVQKKNSTSNTIEKINTWKKRLGEEFGKSRGGRK